MYECNFTTSHTLQTHTSGVAQEDIEYDMVRDVSGCNGCNTASEHTFISLRVLPSPFNAAPRLRLFSGETPVAVHNHGYKSYARK